MISERNRKTLGIVSMAMMVAGAYPPLMGTVPGEVLLFSSFPLQMFFFAITFDFVKLFAILFLVPILAGLPIAMWGFTFWLDNSPTVMSFGFMAILVYFALAYLSIRTIYSRKRKNGQEA